MIRRLFLICLFVLSSLPAYAVNPDEMLSDPKLEARARDISSHLRCLVCQNESIDASNAQLARDLRLLVRKKLEEGDTNEQVYDYVVSRYGEFVLLKPRLSEHTLLLWGAPIGFLFIGLISLVIFSFKRRSKTNVASLSDEEQAKLDALLKD